MSEVVDRVAEAIRLRAIDRGHPIHPVAVHHLAAAAIEAMREPTLTMINAGFLADEDDRMNGGEGAEPFIACWRAMIDDALR